MVPPAFPPELLAREAALAFRGTFEAHLTVEADSPERVAAFEALCTELGVKCVLVELARGQTRSQPMTASYHRGAFGDAVREIERLHAELWARGYPVARVKVEAVVPAPGLSTDDVAAFPGGYFEFHAKLRLPPGANVDDLQALCVAHGAHLSRNDRKRDPRGAAERFVTLRVIPPGDNAAAAFERLVGALEAAGHDVIGTKRELTIYDGKLELDAGWLG